MRQIGPARSTAAFDDPLGNLFDYGVHHDGFLVNWNSEILLQNGGVGAFATAMACARLDRHSRAGGNPILPALR
jgi:hypothetical protein